MEQYGGLSLNTYGRLSMAGVDLADIAHEYGTPLYVMNGDLIRANCRALREGLKKHYGENSFVAYAGKAFSAVYMYRLVRDEGLGADIVSGGELYTAMLSGIPAGNLFFHGNNKSKDELEYALDCGVGRIVVDNKEELFMLDEICAARGRVQEIMLRVSPGIEAHTHDYIKTGQIDSKFGFAMETGCAMNAVRDALSLKNLRLSGIHCHIGSQIFSLEPFKDAARVMVGFMREVKDSLGYELLELNLGGGYGVRYTDADSPQSFDAITEAIAKAVKTAIEEFGITAPRLIIEPGRSIVGEAGVTLYTVGSVKEIPGVRSYISVDGSMADNPRPALYKAQYKAVLPERPAEPHERVYSIAGRCCESDILIWDVLLPEVRPRDLLAVLSTGAYNYSMASNYNRMPRPAVVMVEDNSARLIVRRESYQDVVNCDVL